MSETSKPFANGLAHESIPVALKSPSKPFAESDKKVEQSISHRFEQQAAKYPNRIAVKTTSESLSYDDLNKAANRVARAIVAERGEDPEPVAILLDAEASAITAILGVLKSRKFFVLLKPSHPYVRNNYILQDIQPGLIVTDHENLSLAQQLAVGHCGLLNIDEVGSTVSADNLPLSFSSDNLAYVIYTSGSVGEPKGIVHSHHTALHFRMKGATRLDIGEKDRVTSAVDIFTPIISGAASFPWNVTKDGLANLAGWLMGQEITVYRSFPTAFRHFVGTLTGKEDFPKLRLISLIGEPLYKKDVELFKKHFAPSCLLINNLGSTETGIFRQYVIDRNSEITGNIVPVGYGTEDAEVLLLDDDGKEVGVNCVGEIAVKSRCLSLGYWRRPDLTESLLRSDPKDADQRIYLTGDLGRMSKNGCLDCLGRKDSQVKVRSLRVDTREVEAVLRDHPGIKEIAVIAQEGQSGDMRLVTYFVARTDPAATVSELRNFLKDKISNHMIPSAFVKLDALPLTATGKVDRRALPDPGKARPDLETIYMPPRSPLETELAKIWADLLSLDRIGVNDNFFELGGDSLHAVRLIARIEEVFGKQLIPAKVFQSPTIAQLATMLRLETGPDSASLIPIQPSGSRLPFFWIHGDFSNAFLPRYLGPDQPLYGLEHQSEDGKPARYDRVETIASHYLDEIHAVQPKGPYFLGGYSFGAMVAFEIAQQLKKAGEDVPLLVLLDPPSATSGKSFSYLVRSPPGGVASIALFRDVIRHLGQVGALEKLTYVSSRVKWKVNDEIQQLMRPINKILKKVVWKAYLAKGRRIPLSLRSPYILDIYHQARSKYVPKRYPGRAIYIKGEANSVDHVGAWSRLMIEGMEVYEITGDHADVIKEPHAHLWAEKLKTWLRDAQETDTQKKDN